MSIATIMSPQFGLEDDIVNIYEEIRKTARDNPGDELALAHMWLDMVVEVAGSRRAGRETRLNCARQMIACGITGLYLINKAGIEAGDVETGADQEAFWDGICKGCAGLGALPPENSTVDRKALERELVKPLLKRLKEHIAGQPA